MQTMSNQAKVVIVFALLVTAVGGWFTYNSAEQKRHAQRALGKELNRAMAVMMSDFYRGRASTIRGVAPNGQFYHEVAFKTTKGERISYRLSSTGRELRRTRNGVIKTIALHMDSLKIRREASNPTIIEVYLKARNEHSLESNFKIRMK